VTADIQNMFNLFHSKTHIVAKAAGFVLICALPMTSHSLPDDRLQDLSIQADSAELDDQSGTTTYAGQVIVEQRRLKIRADKVVIFGSNDTYSKVVATGRPARLSQTPNPGDNPVTAQANRLEYRITDETLFLIDNAAFEQEGTSLSGNRIEYDVQKAVVKAGGQSTTTGEDRRVKMIIPPKALSTESDSEQ